MMKGKDLEGSQMRIGGEDGTRDPHPSQRKTRTTSRMINSLTCSRESWPTPWDNERESQRNALPCLEMKNPKIYVCGY